MRRTAIRRVPVPDALRQRDFMVSWAEAVRRCVHCMLCIHWTAYASAVA